MKRPLSFPNKTLITFAIFIGLLSGATSGVAGQPGGGRAADLGTYFGSAPPRPSPRAPVYGGYSGYGYAGYGYGGYGGCRRCGYGGYDYPAYGYPTYGYPTYDYPSYGYSPYGYSNYMPPATAAPDAWWTGKQPSADPRGIGYNPEAGYAWESVTTLLLETFPLKARVTLDGIFVGTADLLGPFQLPIGHHVLRVDAAGYEPSETVLQVAKPIVQQLMVRLSEVKRVAKAAPQK